MDNLEISFLLRVNQKFFDELEIAKDLPNFKRMRQSKNYELVRMEGAISILFNGREILGKNYREEIYDVDFDTPALLDGKSCEEYLPISGHYLCLCPKGDQVMYEVKSVQAKKVLITQSLPLIPFIQKWSYMKYRLMRLAAFLHDNEYKLVDWETWGFGTNKWKGIVGTAKINAIIHNDLVDVLTSTEYR
ncbi:MAG: hypothetical protein IPJ90_00775 [Anaerolineaceae bacterium]|nr:hypothetical protein [Anaerolineaceae bacterium]